MDHHDPTYPEYTGPTPAQAAMGYHAFDQSFFDPSRCARCAYSQGNIRHTDPTFHPDATDVAVTALAAAEIQTQPAPGTTPSCSFIGGHPPGYWDGCAHCYRARHKLGPEFHPPTADTVTPLVTATTPAAPAESAGTEVCPECGGAAKLVASDDIGGYCIHPWHSVHFPTALSDPLADYPIFGPGGVKRGGLTYPLVSDEELMADEVERVRQDEPRGLLQVMPTTWDRGHSKYAKGGLIGVNPEHTTKHDDDGKPSLDEPTIAQMNALAADFKARYGTAPTDISLDKGVLEKLMEEGESAEHPGPTDWTLIWLVGILVVGLTGCLWAACWALVQANS